MPVGIAPRTSWGELPGPGRRRKAPPSPTPSRRSRALRHRPVGDTAHAVFLLDVLSQCGFWWKSHDGREGVRFSFRSPAPRRSMKLLSSLPLTQRKPLCERKTALRALHGRRWTGPHRKRRGRPGGRPGFPTRFPRSFGFPEMRPQNAPGGPGTPGTAFSRSRGAQNPVRLPRLNGPRVERTPRGGRSRPAASVPR